MKLEYLLVAVIGLLGLVSCDKSESLMTILPEDGVIRISAGIDDPPTRVGALTSNLTEFGMFVKAPSTYSYNNVEASKANGVWKTSEMMLWKNETDEVEIVAYAPYNVDFSNLTTVRTISILADQSTDENVIASDFLYARSLVSPSAPDASNLIHYNSDEKKVEAKLNHHFSKLLLTITINGEFHLVPNVATTNPISDIVIKGTNTSATLPLEDGVIETTTNPLSITPSTGAYEGLIEENDTASAEYEAIIIPQTVPTLSIEFTIDGKDYVWTDNDVAFASGKRHTLALTVGKSSVEEALYKVGDVYPKGAVGDAIVGVVWMVKGADGNADLTAGATGASGSIVALRDIEDRGTPKEVLWSTIDFYDLIDLHMHTNLSTIYLNGKANQAYLLDYLEGGIEIGGTNNYTQAVSNIDSHTLDHFPVFKACAEYTDGDALTTWYLPAIDQLVAGESQITPQSGIYFELTRTPSPLAAAIGGIGTNAGGTVSGAQALVKGSYWSSTEAEGTKHYSWYININPHYSSKFSSGNKTGTRLMRCIRDF